VAKPLQTDGRVLGEQTLGRRPILLARLPRVGGPIVLEESEPVFTAVSKEPESAHQKTSYYVDPGHVREPVVTTVEDEQTGQGSLSGVSPEKRKRRAKSRPSSSTSSTKKFSQQPAQPTGFLAASYCKVHEQLAPFAGAIVTLALVSAAGLMYWMTLSPPSAMLNYQEIVNGESDVSPLEIPSFAPQTNAIPEAEATSEVTPIEAAPNEPVVEQVAESVAEVANEVAAKPQAVVESATAASDTVSNAQIEQEKPAVASAPLASEGALGEVSQPAEISVEQPAPVVVYPSTGHPRPLNIAVVLSAGKGGLLAAPQAPAVTAQPLTQPSVPLRR